jgi:hypothetical protein
MNLLTQLASEGGAIEVHMPWYHGIHVSEAMELLLIFTLFIGVLVTVYFIQRWIGDY